MRKCNETEQEILWCSDILTTILYTANGKIMHWNLS